MQLNRPRPLALFFFLACFCTTFALGTWQIQRLHWKESLIARIEAAKSQPPLIQLPEEKTALKAIEFYPVALHGTWVRNTEFHITPRFFKGTLGYFIIAPFKLDDGRILMVNRGWVPADKKEPSSRPETKVSGSGTIHGLIRVGDERNALTPPNHPEENLWFGRDFDAMGAEAKLSPIVPCMVDIVGAQDPQHLPIPSDGTIRLLNDHLSYIITWYGIAAGILVIFILTLRKKP